MRSSAATPTFEQARQIGESCLCFQVQRAGRALARRFDEALRPCDLTSWQFAILMSLTNPTPPSLSGLADWLVMDRTTLTANLKPLERRGLVDVRADRHDRRVRRLTLTRRGRALLARAVPHWEAAQADAAERLSPSAADALRKSLSFLAREPAQLHAL